MEADEGGEAAAQRPGSALLEHRRAETLSRAQQPQELLGGQHGGGREAGRSWGVRWWDLPGQCQDVMVTVHRSLGWSRPQVPGEEQLWGPG